MAEFEDKLNALLSNPESMAQVMQMAQALSGSMGGGQGDSGAASSPDGGGPSMPFGDASAFGAAPWNAGTQNQGPPPPPPMGAPGPDLFSSLGGMLGGMDPKMLTRLLPLVSEFAQGQNTQAVQLLHALRPFLKTERQDKVDRALQLARMIHIGKKFFAGWEV